MNDEEKQDLDKDGATKTGDEETEEAPG